MTTQGQSYTLTRQIAASPAHVYYSLTHEHQLRRWLCEGAWAQQRQGGRFLLNWNTPPLAGAVIGEFAALEQDQAVTLKWRGWDDHAASEVKIALAEKNGGTELTLTHSGFESANGGGAARERAQQIWEAGLENLQELLQSGKDLRLIRRPMLGITLDELNEESRKRWGIPVTEGILMDGTIDGMGAQAAGLQKGDVIVSLGGVKTPEYNGLVSSLQGRHAGDTVAVEFYRGAEKKSVQMKLSGRQMPDVPPTAAGLAATLRELSDKMEAGLDEALQGVTEEIASHHPAEGEWNVKEIIAHLILSERDSQYYLAAAISNDEIVAEVYNQPARVKAVVAANPTLADMREAFRCAVAETVAMHSDRWRYPR